MAGQLRDQVVVVGRTTVIKAAHLDCKYLLRCSHPTLSAEEIALSYKQLLL